MACQFEVLLNAGQYEQGTETALAALDVVDALEDQLSVFRPHTELSRINRLAAAEAVPVEPQLFRLLELCLRLHAETGGAFDITASPLWRAWGFARREGAIPNEAQLAEAMSRVGSQLVKLDADTHTVRFLRPGVELNLGSIGKGYALDRAAEVLAAAGINDYLIHGGNSSITARGSRMEPGWRGPERSKGHGSEGWHAPERSEGRGTPAGASSTPFVPQGVPPSADVPPDAGGWTVGLPHPLRPGRRLAEIRLRDRALGTSSSEAQYFRHRGKRYGHVLDPRTGWPADKLLSATVLAPSAALADALATAFYVMGHEAALDFCRTRPELAAVLVAPATRGQRFEIHSIGLEQDDLTVLAKSG
jgi:thiamine biosynthesis lipoprotein